MGMQISYLAGRNGGQFLFMQGLERVIAILVILKRGRAEFLFVLLVFDEPFVGRFQGGFLLPFMFIYCPIILLKPGESLWLDIIALAACFLSILALQIGFTGFFKNNCTYSERSLFIISSVLLLVFLLFQKDDLMGPGFFCSGLLVFIAVTIIHWRKRRPSGRSPLGRLAT